MGDGRCVLARMRMRDRTNLRIKLTFQDSKGKEIKTIEGNEGDDILSLAHEHDVDLEGEPLT